MNCFDEERLRRMILANAALDLAESDHLLTCDRCRKSWLMWAALHQETMSSAPARSTRAVKNTKAQKAGDAVITTLEPISLSGIRGLASSRLAARGEQPVSVYQVSSFSNPEEGLIGRLLYDETTRHLQFFLLTESAASAPGIKVILDQGKLTGFTDNQGCIDFGEQPLCQYEQVQIIGPNSSIDLTQHQGKLPCLRALQGKAGSRHHDQEIDIEIAHTEAGSRYAITIKRAAHKGKRSVMEVVGITNQRVLTARTRNGRAVLEIPAGEALHKIHIY